VIYAGYCKAKPRDRAKRVVGILLVRAGKAWKELATVTAATPFAAMQAVGGLYDAREDVADGDSFEWAGLLDAAEAAERWPAA